MKLFNVKLCLTTAILCLMGTFAIFSDAASDKAAAQKKLVDDRKTNFIATSEAINNAKVYDYSKAIKDLLIDLGDMTSEIRRALKTQSTADQNTFRSECVKLVSALVNDRVRATPDDIKNLGEFIDGATSLLGMYGKDTVNKPILNDLREQLNTKIVEKTDFKSIIGNVTNSLVSATTVDSKLFDKVAELVRNKLDDEDDRFTITTASGKSVIVENGNTIWPSGDGSITGLTYESSWDKIRGVLTSLGTNKAYSAYQDSITLKDESQSFNGTLKFNEEMRKRLSQPLSLNDFARSFDKLVGVIPFTEREAARLMNRVRLLTALMKQQVIRSNQADATSIRDRLGYAKRQLLSSDNVKAYTSTGAVDTATASSTKLTGYGTEIDDLMKTYLGTEAINAQMPEKGKIIALKWSDPATPTDVKYVQVVQVGTGQSQHWELACTAVDYVGQASLFKVDILGSKMGMQSIVANNSYVIVQANATGNDGIVRVSGTDLSDTKRQFVMEGDKAAASFRSASFSGKSDDTTTSGYLSVGNDGNIYSYNKLTHMPCGVSVDGKFQASAREKFTIVEVDDFFVNLGKLRTQSISNRLAGIASAANEAATPDAGSPEKRLVIAQELKRFVDGTETALTADDDKKALADALTSVNTQFKAFTLKEPQLKSTLSYARAASKTTPLTIVPAYYPADSKTYVIFVPGTGVSGGRYVTVVSETGDNDEPRYVLQATAVDPISQASQFKVSRFNNIIAFESAMYPGMFIKATTITGDDYTALSSSARKAQLRLECAALAKDERGQVMDYWEAGTTDVPGNADAQFNITQDANKYIQLQSVLLRSSSAVTGYVRIDDDKCLRVYDPSKAALTPLVIANVTGVKLVPIKSLYATLSAQRENKKDIERVQAYRDMVNRVDSAEDIRLVLGEISAFLDSKRGSDADWNEFQKNLPLLTRFADLFKTFETSFKDELDANSDLKGLLNDTKQKSTTAPLIASTDVPREGTVVALAWKNNDGKLQYVSVRKDIVVPADLGDAKTDTPNNKLPSADFSDDIRGVSLYTLALEDKTPVSADTHFKIVQRQGTNVLALHSVTADENVQAICTDKLSDPKTYRDSRPTNPLTQGQQQTFDKLKNTLLVATVNGNKFSTDADSVSRKLEDFIMVGNSKTASFLSQSTGGYLSISPVVVNVGTGANKTSYSYIVTVNPITLQKAGMLRGGRVDPSPREQFELIIISAYIQTLGDVRTKSELKERLAGYLANFPGMTSGLSEADRKVFFGEIKREADAILSTKANWDAYIANEDAQSAMAAIIGQMNQDDNFKNELKDQIEALEAAISVGFSSGEQLSLPPKGSVIVLQSLAGDLLPADPDDSTKKMGKYVRVVQEGKNTLLMLGGQDPLDAECQLTVDVFKGQLGFKSTDTSSKYIRSDSVDPAVAANWIYAKKNDATKLMFIGSSFGRKGGEGETFIMEGSREIATFKNVGTDGYLSLAYIPNTPNATFGSDKYLRTLNNSDMTPLKKTKRVQAKDASGNLLNNTDGTPKMIDADEVRAQFKIIVFDDFYKGLAAARSENDLLKKIAALDDLVSGGLLSSVDQLTALKLMLQKFYADVTKDKQSGLWKEFSGQVVQPKYLALIDHTIDKYSSLDASLSDALTSLKNYEATEVMPTYISRFAALQDRLANLSKTSTADEVEAFMRDLQLLVDDRVSGVVVTTSDSKNKMEKAVGSKISVPKATGTGTELITLTQDMVDTAIDAALLASDATLTTTVLDQVSSWISDGVKYHAGIAGSTDENKKNVEIVVSLIAKMATPITYDEYLKYIDRVWISGKTRFTAQEKIHVMRLLKGLVCMPWLKLASSEDVDLQRAKDLVAAARANQFGQDMLNKPILSAIIEKGITFPIVDGKDYLASITASVNALIDMKDQSTPEFAAALAALNNRAGLWIKDGRVLLDKSTTGGKGNELNLDSMRETLQTLVAKIQKNDLKAPLKTIMAQLSKASSNKNNGDPVLMNVSSTTSGTTTSLATLAGSDASAGMPVNVIGVTPVTSTDTATITQSDSAAL